MITSQFRLLTYLARNADKVLTFEQILSNVWGHEYSGSWGTVMSISHISVRNLEKIPKAHGTSLRFMLLDTYSRNKT